MPFSSFPLSPLQLPVADPFLEKVNLSDLGEFLDMKMLMAMGAGSGFRKRRVLGLDSLGAHQLAATSSSGS